MNLKNIEPKHASPNKSGLYRVNYNGAIYFARAKEMQPRLVKVHKTLDSVRVEINELECDLRESLVDTITIYQIER